MTSLDECIKGYRDNSDGDYTDQDELHLQQVLELHKQGQVTMNEAINLLCTGHK